MKTPSRQPSRSNRRTLVIIFVGLSLLVAAYLILYHRAFDLSAERTVTTTHSKPHLSSVRSHQQPLFDQDERPPQHVSNVAVPLPPQVAKATAELSRITSNWTAAIVSGASKWAKYIAPPLPETERRCLGDMRQSSTKPTYSICTHGMNDVVSSFIQRDGFWRDCIPQVALATLVRMFTPATREGHYTMLDVGGNIGSCATLLASRGFHVLSFEPVTKNLEVFKHTIAANHMESSIQVFATAASTVSEKTFDIAVENGNHGNSVMIDRKTSVGAAVLRSMSVQTETIVMLKIDDVIQDLEKNQTGEIHSETHFHFAKLDCQGSELSALRGGEISLLSRHAVDMFYIEIETRLSRAVGNEPRDLLQLLHRYNYQMFVEIDQKPVFIVPKDFDSFSEGCAVAAKDIVAVSPGFVARVGLERLFQVFSVSHDRIAKWLQTDADVDRLPAEYAVV